MPRSIGIVTAADSRERSHGQLHVYDGEGKGKSQAALGVVLRTIGLGICEQRRTRVLLLRFLLDPGEMCCSPKANRPSSVHTVTT